ncbi:MAG: hypothetical protein AABO41_15220 [Acidobacteriota bacterium]
MPSFSNHKWTTCLFFLALAAPVLIAIWFVPWFVTQDGPRHVYNAHILSALSNEQSPFKDFYAARAGLLPCGSTRFARTGFSLSQSLNKVR